MNDNILFIMFLLSIITIAVVLFIFILLVTISKNIQHISNGLDDLDDKFVDNANDTDISITAIKCTLIDIYSKVTDKKKKSCKKQS